MTILTALRKIDTLSSDELRHMIQLLDDDRKRYEDVVKHYSLEKIERFARPYLNRLHERRQKFVDALKQARI